MSIEYRNAFIPVIIGIVLGVIVVSFIVITAKKSSEDYKYKSCVERQFTYDKVDIDTAKINCKKVWKE